MVIEMQRSDSFRCKFNGSVLRSELFSGPASQVNRWGNSGAKEQPSRKHTHNAKYIIGSVARVLGSASKEGEVGCAEQVHHQKEAVRTFLSCL